MLELRDWADALVERYGGVPVGPEWDNDPIVSRLKPELAESLRPEMLRLTSEAWEKHPRRMLAMSDKDQIALAQSALDRGIPYEQREALRALAITHSSLILPLIEAKVEAVLKSPEQIEPNVDISLRPDRYIVTAMGIIAYAGDEEALKQLAKLMKTAGFAKLQLQDLVSSTLGWAGERGNPFALAYRGLEMGDTDVDKPIIAWAERRLAEPSLNQTKDPRRQLAKAMVNRYGALPTPEQWAKDPLVSRLKPSLAESVPTSSASLPRHRKREFKNEVEPNRIRPSGPHDAPAEDESFIWVTLSRPPGIPGLAVAQLDSMHSPRADAALDRFADQPGKLREGPQYERVRSSNSPKDRGRIGPDQDGPDGPGLRRNSAAIFRAGEQQAEDEAFDRVHGIGLPQVSKIPLDTAHRGDGTHIGRRVPGGGRREQDRQDSDDGCFSSHTHKTAHPREKLAAGGRLTKLNVGWRLPQATRLPAGAGRIGQIQI